MLHTVQFSDLIWNGQAILLPEVNKTYLLTQVKLKQIESDESTDGSKKYALYVNRSMELVCYIIVNPSDTNNLKALQNNLLKNTIKRFGR